MARDDVTQGEKETFTASVKDNSKSIPAKYKGVVSSYEVLEQFEKDGQVHVKIKALIFKECRPLEHCAQLKADCSCYLCDTGYKLVDKECLPCEDKETRSCTEGKKWSKDKQACVYDSHDYKSKSLIKKADYSLAVVPFKVKSSARCLGKKVSADEMNELISNLFVENLTPARKFNLVDRNNFASYQDELDLISEDMTLPENKVRLKNIVPADYILVGTIDNFTATSNKTFIEFTGETVYESSATLKVSYRILETATMEIVSAGSVTKKFNKDGAFSSCFNIEELLLRRAIGDASEKLLIDIFPDYQPKPKTKADSKKTSAQPRKTVEEDYSLMLD